MEEKNTQTSKRPLFSSVVNEPPLLQNTFQALMPFSRFSEICVRTKAALRLGLKSAQCCYTSESRGETLIEL